MLVLAGGLAACTPPMTRSGSDVAFHPVVADAQPRLVASAVELKVEADQEPIKEAGGVYLGELEVTVEQPQYASGSAGSAASLSGPASLDAARFGGTHFYLTKLNTTDGVWPPAHVDFMTNGRGGGFQRTKAIYVVYRVAPEAWSQLEPRYRPDSLQGR